jgi:hypothetical protein
MELTLESALSPQGLFGHTSYILLVISMMMRRMVWLRILVILSAIVGITYASVVLSDPVGTFWETLLVLVNIVQLTITWHQNRSARFTDEERVFMDGHLPNLSMAQRRKLLNQGLWVSGEKDSPLTEEGVPVSHLYYLADGQALVSSGGHAVAVCEPGTFIGEMTAMHGDPANGTVKLIRDSRYWAIDAQRLRDLVSKDPEIGTALESSFARNMRDKLVRSNRFILESGGVRRPSPLGPRIRT